MSAGVDDNRIGEIWDLAYSLTDPWGWEDGKEGYRTPLWNLCRLLKGDWPFMCEHSALEHLLGWMQRTGRSFTDIPGIDDHAQGLEEFEATWPNVRIPAGKTPLGWAFEQAKSRPVVSSVPGCGEPFCVLLNVCYYLQIIAGSKPIYLSCRDGAELILGSRDKYSRLAQLIQIAEHRGYLRPVAEGSYAKKRAAEFRFVGLHGPYTQELKELRNIGVETKQENQRLQP